MTTTQHSSDKALKYIVLLVVLSALLLAEALHAQVNKNQSRFSANTLRIGIEHYLSDRLEESDEFEIAGDMQEQLFDESFVVARCEAQENTLSGNTKVALIFSKNERVLRRVYVPVRITLRRMVPVLTRALQRGDVVQQSDVEYKLSDVTYLQAKAAKEFVGMRLIQNASRGAILTEEMLTKNSSVQRGDAVMIMIQNGGVTVRANGQALDDGSTGQTIRVRRDDSSVILSGVVREDKTIVIGAQAATTQK